MPSDRLLLFHENKSQVVMRPGVLGIESQRLSITQRGLRESSLVLVDNAQVVVRSSVLEDRWRWLGDNTGRLPLPCPGSPRALPRL